MKLKAFIITLVSFVCVLVLRAQDTAGTPQPSPDADGSGENSFYDAVNRYLGTGIIEGRVSTGADGKALNNTRLRIKGTIREELTNEFGEYRLSNLPAGDIEIEVYYTGMITVNETVKLEDGQRITRDFNLIPLGSETDKKEDVVHLEKYSVVSQREMSMGAIAINEQRFAKNIKTVIETDAFGEQATAGVGDFLKFLPGVAMSMDGDGEETASVRGFGPAFTSVTTDGVDVANTGVMGDDESRAFTFDQVSINNISLIEVAKVPLPSMRADTLGGTINFVTKNAFDRKKAGISYRVTYSLNSENLEFMRKTPGPLYEYTYKAVPGFALDWNFPVTNNFRMVVTSNIFNRSRELHTSETEWNFNANPMDRNLQKDPYLERYQMRTSPSVEQKDSFQVRADWRVNRNHIFSLTYGISYNEKLSGTRTKLWDARDADVDRDNQAGKYQNREWGYTPEYGYFVESAETRPGRTGGYVRQTVGAYGTKGITNQVKLTYNYTGDMWNINGTVNASEARSWRRDGDNGYFSSARASIKGKTGRIGIYNIDPSGDNAPAVLKAYQSRSDQEIDEGFLYGEEIDVFNINNYVVDTVQLTKVDSKDTRKGINLNVLRKLGGLPFGATVQVGGDYRSQVRDRRNVRNTMTLLNGVSEDTDPMMPYKEAAAYIDEGYSKVNPGWGLPNITWISPKKLYDTYLEHPEWFIQTDSQAQSSLEYTYRQSQKVSEDVYAFYFQLNGNFFHNRLMVATGVRWEMTDNRGLGALEPTEGDTAEDILANWKIRGASSKRTYNDLYPSLHLNYNVTENLILRLAYATTMSRPNFSNIIPNIRIHDRDSIYESEIRIKNTNLDPYKAHNFDFSLEYYTQGGGSISAGLFYKKISNFFGEVKTVATMDVLSELGLGTEYLDYIVVTDFNLSSMTTVYGGEFNFSTPLDFLGDWGRNFTFRFNATKTSIDADPLANLGGMVESSTNFGFQYRYNRIMFSVMANYRGREQRNAQTGGNYQRDSEDTWDKVQFEGFYEYTVPSLKFDVNMSYNFSKRFSFYASALNITNQPDKLEIYNATSNTYAPYANPYRAMVRGAEITIGIRGKF